MNESCTESGTPTCYLHSSWTCIEKSTVICIVFHCKQSVISLLLLSRFSLSLIFSFIIMYCGMNFLKSILFEVLSTSWICRFMSFAKFGIFSHGLSTTSAPYFFFPLYGILMTWILYLWLQSHRSLSIFFPSIFFSCSGWLISIVLTSCSLILFSMNSILAWPPLVSFLFWLLHFSLYLLFPCWELWDFLPLHFL